MTHITERLAVHCPDHEAAGWLAAFLAKHQAADGKVRLTLRLPLRIFADRPSLIERGVIATLFPLHSDRDPHPTYSVTWSAQGGGPYPGFAGALAVEKGTCDDSFGLIVSGSYDPPLGMVGALFDAALGRRIANLSARDLLRSIAEYVEQSFARNEAARAGHLPRCFPMSQPSSHERTQAAPAVSAHRSERFRA